MFGWFTAKNNKILKLLKSQYKKNMSPDEKKHLLTTLNFFFQDTQDILKNDNIIDAIEKYIENTFYNYENFYKNWNSFNDMKHIFNGSINIIYFFGNNGIGKTTSIVNLAKILKNQGYNPLLIAADEFRGGAVEQLIDMAAQEHLPVYSSLNYEKEPSLSQIIFDGIKNNYHEYNTILIDTAGRSHHDLNLIDNLKKQYDISKKVTQDIPNTKIFSLWVNDGNIVNAFNQQKLFFDKIPVDYSIMTKIKDNQGYYNFLNIIKETQKPIIFYSPSSKNLEIFNKNIFLNDLS